MTPEDRAKEIVTSWIGCSWNDKELEAAIAAALRRQMEGQG